MTRALSPSLAPSPPTEPARSPRARLTLTASSAPKPKIIASAYSVGSDNRGCATLATPFGTFVTHFALGSMSSSYATAGRIIEWDSPSASAYIASGQLLAQSTSAFAAGLTGSLRLPHRRGWDLVFAVGGREVCVGALSAGGYAF